MNYSDDGEGLHRHVDPVDGRVYLYAMSFLNAGPRWFACFDQPDLKSRYEITVEAPDSWTVLGNGPSRAEAPGRWRITPTAPLSTYFVTLVAGPYASVHDEHVSDGVRIPLGLHVRASLGSQLHAEAADLFEVTKQSFDYYHRVFGVRYPFGEYHQAFVPDFNAGAMENPGCVTLRDQFIFRSRATAAERASRAGVVAHEMAHMWFGDLVTMAWWDDLWLNESFAEYMAHRCCTESTRYPLWTEFGISRKDWGFQADQAPSTHPIAGNGAADADSALQDFDGISYAKGAAVLRQLAAHLGDEVFFGGLNRHFRTHGYANATFADLIDAWGAAGASNLDSWAAAWLRTSGLDQLSADGRALVRTSSSPTPRPHTVQVAAFDADGRPSGRLSATVTDESEVAAVLPPAELVVADADDETWAKIRFGGRTWPQVLAVAPRVEAPATRVVLANAVRDAVRDAEIDPRLALEGLLALVRSEQSEIVMASLLRFTIDTVAGGFSAPSWRPQALAGVRAVAGELLARAEAGSDRQLTAFRAAVRSGTDPGELRAWLAGDDLPAGLTLDPELSWSLVIRLATLTGDAEVIEQQTRRDPSAAGRAHAAQARAALRDAAAKESAWRLLMAPSALSAYELYATASGFFQPTQHELCAPYADRYFDEIAATGTFRSGWSLGQTAMLAYPLPHAESQVLAQAERCLSEDGLEPALRRSIVDGTDKLRRAVLARARFS
jgi:aminopeptidase N